MTAMIHGGEQTGLDLVSGSFDNLVDWGTCAVFRLFLIPDKVPVGGAVAGMKDLTIARL
jgi:hypothetical protein